MRPRELLGLTATPERSDGLPILDLFGGRIAAELRLWDAIDQQRLSPFVYYGIHDGLDLRKIPWRRGRGYDVTALEPLPPTTLGQAGRRGGRSSTVDDVGRMRALGFCVSVDHARVHGAASARPGSRPWRSGPIRTRRTAPERSSELAAGRVRSSFRWISSTKASTYRCRHAALLRPTDSPLLFLQQLGRGLRRAEGKTVCTVLDFVGHTARSSASTGASGPVSRIKKRPERQIAEGFPFLPAGCHIELEPVAQEIVLRSLREAIPSNWRSRQQETCRRLVRSISQTFLGESGLELDDIYTGNRSWSSLRRAVDLPTAAPGQSEDAPACRWTVAPRGRPSADYRLSQLPLTSGPTRSRDAHRSRPSAAAHGSSLPLRRRPSSNARRRTGSALVAPAGTRRAIRNAGAPPRTGHTRQPIDRTRPRATATPLALHPNKILAAFGIGEAAKPPEWREGVRWDEGSQTDLFAFTLDKSDGNFSPTTRYRDYAISPTLIHWESQSTTSSASPVGERYISHRTRGTNIVLFARLRTRDRAFWCLGPASYASHEGERPIAFVWGSFTTGCPQISSLRSPPLPHRRTPQSSRLVRPPYP